MGQIRIELDADSRVQLATQHIGRKILRVLRVHNLSEDAFGPLSIVIQVDPDIALEHSIQVDGLAPGAIFEVPESQLGLRLSAERLANQTERQPGYILVRVMSAGVVLAEHSHPIEIFAINEWLGGAAPPEMLATFVTPNHPDMETVLHQARQLLEQQGVSSSLEGYQNKDPQRVLALAGAAYRAISALQIGYANPPASFENYGQKIRDVAQVLSGKVATCLDLSVLLAGALEQMGLHPLLIMQQGHAFVGVWLTDWQLPTAFVDDPLPIRKRVDLGECVVFDSSSSAQGVPFAKACEAGLKFLQDTPTFMFALDIRAARMEGIGPMGVLRQGTYTPVVRPLDVVDTSLPALAPLIDNIPADESPAGRIERWKTRLLDLSLRNRLLNHRDSKTVLPLLGSVPGVIEDVLTSKGELELVARTGQVEDEELHVNGQLTNGRLAVALAPAEFANRALELYRKNSQMVEDSGTSALFLSLGMLKWFESANSFDERKAPILLVPVTLRRRSVGGPYFVVRGDDDVLLNSTLLKKLELDFGIRVPLSGNGLPQDESGVDVDAVLRMVLSAIKDQPRFDVERRADISFLQFQKFMMWTDLEQNADILLSSEVVRHIVEGSEEPFPQNSPLIVPEKVEDRPAREDLSVVDSDSSQIAAVFSALEGNSFVLQGPPGTGKSQTITNLIAQAMGQGKTVLFVSEKRAALEVVEERLKAVGLGPFSLEVHSDKASKAEVVRQLEDPFKYQWKKPDEDWSVISEHLQKLRETLSAHVQKMHAPGPFGETLYQVVSKLMALNQLGIRAVPQSFEKIPDARQYEELRDLLAKLAVQTKRTGIPARHPWHQLTNADWSTTFASLVQQHVSKTLSAAEAWKISRDHVVSLLAEEVPESLRHDVGEAALALGESPGVAAAMLKEPRAQIENLLSQATTHLRAHHQGATLIGQSFELALLSEVDLPAEQKRFKRWAEAFVLFAFLMLFFARRRLAKFAKTGLPENSQIVKQLQTAIEVNAEQKTIDSLDGELRRVFGVHWKGVATSPEDLENVWKWAVNFRGILARIRESNESIAERILGIAQDDERLGEGTRTGAAVRELAVKYGTFRSELDGLNAVITTDTTWKNLSPDRCLEGLRVWNGAHAQLQDWCDWVRNANACEEAGLGTLVNELRVGNLDHESLLPTFERSVRERWWERASQEDKELRQFRGHEHERVIARFQDLDRQAKDVARREIQARLAARLPDWNAPGEMEILRREFSKKTRHKPVRKLFSEVPNVLLRLKPCVLMSPLSVARFLDPKLSLFDLVVFDEASQIPPWDSVGALARGKQAIVVGDSRQLPPTNFFTREDNDEDMDDEDQVEMESILDQAVLRGMPQLTLNWHYRSRHESLIAFSNHHYYDNRLHIFPSPHHNSTELGLKWVEVPEGFYDRGGTRANKGEATRVVAELVRRLEDPILSQKSIGVVTFSMAQQKQVEDLLDVQRRARPHLEKFFTHAVPEPVFIKNLENVQGDERDVMLFSIGYGPDQAGRVTQNFGPLNRVGGERRLNVAVTRARELLVVFSTLRPDQIDLSRVNAVGVKHLKTFLDYAARGHDAILEAVKLDPKRGFDSPFEEQVFEALTSHGWQVHKQVGVGGFFIDLAVVDPARPGAYLLGIECDGAAYHSAKTARDRDRIRQAILENLGWRIHRIWSTDWWTQQGREIDRVLAVLKEVQQISEVQAIKDRALPTPVSNPLPPARDVVSHETSWPDYASAWRNPPSPSGGPKDLFYHAHEEVLGQLEAIVGHSSPILVVHAAQLITRAWELASTTQKARDYILELASKADQLVVDQDVLWASESHRAEWRGFRYHDQDSRKFEEIPQPELTWVAAWVVERAVSISREDLVREVAKTYNTQPGSKIRETIQAAIDHAIGVGLLTDNQGTMSLL